MTFLSRINNISDFNDFIERVNSKTDAENRHQNKFLHDNGTYTYEEIVDQFCEVSSHYNSITDKLGNEIIALIEKIKLLPLPTSDRSEPQKVRSWQKGNPEFKLSEVQERIKKVLKGEVVDREVKDDLDRELKGQKDQSSNSSSGDGNVETLIWDTMRLTSDYMDIDSMRNFVHLGFDNKSIEKRVQDQFSKRHIATLDKTLAIIEEAIPDQQIKQKMIELRKKYGTDPNMSISNKELQNLFKEIVTSLVQFCYQDPDYEDEIKNMQVSLNELEDAYEIFFDLSLVVLLKTSIRGHEFRDFHFDNFAVDERIEQLSPEVLNLYRDEISQFLIVVSYTGLADRSIRTFILKLLEINEFEYAQNFFIAVLNKSANEIAWSTKKYIAAEILSYLDIPQAAKFVESLPEELRLDGHLELVLYCKKIGNIDEANKYLKELESFSFHEMRAENKRDHLLKVRNYSLLLAYLAMDKLQAAERLLNDLQQEYPHSLFSIFTEFMSLEESATPTLSYGFAEVSGFNNDFREFPEVLKLQIEDRFEILLKINNLGDKFNHDKLALFQDFIYYYLKRNNLKKALEIELLTNEVSKRVSSDKTQHRFYQDVNYLFAQSFLKSGDITKVEKYLAELSLSKLLEIANDNLDNLPFQELVQNRLKSIDLSSIRGNLEEKLEIFEELVDYYLSQEKLEDATEICHRFDVSLSDGIYRYLEEYLQSSDLNKIVVENYLKHLNLNEVLSLANKFINNPEALDLLEHRIYQDELWNIRDLELDDLKLKLNQLIGNYFSQKKVDQSRELIEIASKYIDSIKLDDYKLSFAKTYLDLDEYALAKKYIDKITPDEFDQLISSKKNNLVALTFLWHEFQMEINLKQKCVLLEKIIIAYCTRNDLERAFSYYRNLLGLTREPHLLKNAEKHIYNKLKSAEDIEAVNALILKVGEDDPFLLKTYLCFFVEMNNFEKYDEFILKFFNQSSDLPNMTSFFEIIKRLIKASDQQGSRLGFDRMFDRVSNLIRQLLENKNVMNNLELRQVLINRLKALQNYVIENSNVQVRLYNNVIKTFIKAIPPIPAREIKKQIET